MIIEKQKKSEVFSLEEFSDKTEHELVKRIRECDAFVPELSIVADEEIVGHIMLSKIAIEQDGTCRIASTCTSVSC